jgi:hypothetical protein
MNTIKVIYPNMLDVGCFSHALDHVGDKFQTPVLESFISSWIMLFPIAQNLNVYGRNRQEKSIVTHSKTRWWSRWEIMHQLFLQFGDVHPFLPIISLLGHHVGQTT